MPKIISTSIRRFWNQISCFKPSINVNFSTMSTDTQVLPDFINFLNESCTNFHAVDAAKSRLLANGFQQISESETWNLEIGKKYFFIRNGTSLIAFFVGNQFKSGNGFVVIGAHTDRFFLN